MSLKKYILGQNISSFGIIGDLEILNLPEWSTLIEIFDTNFEGLPIIAVLYLDNLSVPPVQDQYKLLKEYHEPAIGGHRGINKTYSKIAKDYYWRNMRPDLRQFVLGCTQCQTNKLIRVKTRPTDDNRYTCKTVS